jgi:hypothetical protein
MMQGNQSEEKALQALREAVAEALEKKRRLGQYAVFWENGRIVLRGEDAPKQEQDTKPKTE